MNDKKSLRPETEIIADLARLCVRPGYVHAVAYFCHRDNFIHYSDKVLEKDLERMFDPSRLIRTEINTLIGLMIKDEIQWDLPTPDIFREYVDTTEALLEELHQTMSAAMAAALFADLPRGIPLPIDPASKNSPGAAMREPIFYGGESAYSFQYLDLAARKYADDAEWLIQNRGFTIEDARTAAMAVEKLQSKRVVDTLQRFRKEHVDEWTMLPAFIVKVQEIAEMSGLSVELTERILSAFSIPATERNAGFVELNDFNAACATPLLRTPSKDFLSLQSYAFAEAVYDTPFYWMARDRAYQPTLTKHRGEFTERFASQRLERVFGSGQVYANVDIQESKAVRLGEIDILVVWGDRAIVVQAKSKRLTLEARKGNDQVIKDDFKKSVQDSYDQAITCASLLQDERVTLQSADGRKVVFNYALKEIYIFCIVSDHYPALSFQAREFLRTRTAARIQPPVVMDVFTLDAMTEMLQTPLHFLSYVNRRARFTDQLLATQELTILSYHLRHNLWVKSDIDLVNLGDDFAAGLDIAMTARRRGIDGAQTPDGFLSRVDQTTLGQIAKQIEARPEPATIELGFQVLALSESAIKGASKAVDELMRRARADGRHHDVTFALDSDGAGLTIHINDDSAPIAGPRLGSYCERRKYKQKANRWFGVCMSPTGPTVRFGVSLDFPWSADAAMDEATRKMQASTPARKLFKALDRGFGKGIRSTAPCPCGSGRKYKHCHLR